MRLRLESRAVGEVLIVQCHGRIVAGNEVLTLHAQVGDSIVKYGDVVLQLDHVEFIDSSGLGALVRLMQAARSKGGDVKLSGVPPKIRKTLEMTNLLAQFEAYDLLEEAITAAYLGSRYSRGKAGDARPRILCVYDSTDVCTFLREVLCSAGYNALTTLSLDDARILLKATKAKLVVISAHMQSSYGRPTRKVLEEIDPAVSMLILDEDFATQDPGEAAEKLLIGIGSAATRRSSQSPVSETHPAKKGRLSSSRPSNFSDSLEQTWPSGVPFLILSSEGEDGPSLLRRLREQSRRSSTPSPMMQVPWYFASRASLEYSGSG